MVKSIFDLLGILAPFLLPLKLSLQRLAGMNLGRDVEIPATERKVWVKFLNAFPRLSSLTVPRCFAELSPSKDYQLHVFADASVAGIGAVCYLRTFSDGVNYVSFIIGKSRVPPVKSLTTPRICCCCFCCTLGQICTARA